MTEGHLEKIKSRGYWRVNFRPLTADIRLKTMQECRDIVEKNSVELRGWDYPHFPRRNDEKVGTAPAGDFFEGWEDWENHKEFWRMYKTGQFLYYRALREDWLDERGGIFTTPNDKSFKAGEKIGVLGSLVYEITECFQFLSRLVERGLYEKGVKVHISLVNTKGRELVVDDGARIPFMYARKTEAPELSFEKTYTKEEILNDSKGLAHDIIMQVADSFGWNPAPEQVAGDQEKLISRRF